MRELDDSYSLLEALGNVREAMADPAQAANRGRIAEDFLTAYAEELARAAEADMLLDVLQDPATTELGFDVMLPNAVLDAAEAKGIDLESRAVLWEGVAYLRNLNGDG